MISRWEIIKAVSNQGLHLRHAMSLTNEAIWETVGGHKPGYSAKEVFRILFWVNEHSLPFTVSRKSY